MIHTLSLTLSAPSPSHSLVWEAEHRLWCSKGSFVFEEVRLSIDLTFISLIYRCVCVCWCVCVCMYCFLGDMWEGVRRSDVKVTGCISSWHSLSELLVFRGGWVQGLVGDESDGQTRHKSADQPIRKFVCISRVATSGGQLLCAFMTEYVNFN